MITPRAKTERVLQVVLIALVAVFLAIAARSFHENNTVVGDSAPSFSIVADNGQKITRSNFGGKVLVLNFWASWCAPCVTEIPSLDAMQRELGKDVVVVAVSVDQDEKQYKQFLATHKVSFLTARDPEANISGDYGTYKYPETYIIGSDGKVREKVISNTDWMDPAQLARIKNLL